MKKLIVIGVGLLLLNGCVTKVVPQKSSVVDDEPAMVTSSISVEVTQEMIDRYNATHAKK